MRDFTKLTDEFKRKFEDSKQGRGVRPGDLTYNEILELIRMSKEKELQDHGSGSINSLIGEAVLVTWKAAYMAGYKRAQAERKNYKKL